MIVKFELLQTYGLASGDAREKGSINIKIIYSLALFRLCT